jgi:eukaryotic-like serine/threonine-protein kinase
MSAPASGPASSKQRRIGKYELLGPLGSGGMAVVFKARDTSLERVVALKLMNQQLQGGDVARKRFFNEARVLAGLQHSNISFIYDFGIEDNQPYIVMEYLPGSDLHELIQAGHPLSLQQKLKIAVQVARALRCAHAQGVVHRDIKPSNIRVLQDGLAKLMDFGIATIPLEQGLDKLTQTGTVLGSIRYMAPEQIHGETVTPQTDIFSFGAVLYELLTYRPAYGGDNLAAVIASISRGAPPRIDTPDVPEGLRRVVAGCLRRSPWDRYHGVDEILTALQRVEEALWQAALREGDAPAQSRPVAAASAAVPAADTPALDSGEASELLQRSTRPAAIQGAGATGRLAAQRLRGRRLWRAAAIGVGLMLGAAVGLAMLSRLPPAEPAVVRKTAPVAPLPLETAAAGVSEPAALPARDLRGWQALLQHGSRAERQAAARALAALGAEAVPVLGQTLTSPEAEVRILAAIALGQIGPEASEAVPLLVAALGDANRIVQVWANYALTRIDAADMAGLSALVRSLKDPEPAVRLEAVRALQFSGHAEALPALRRSVLDPDEKVRAAAETALGRLGGQGT